MENVFWDKAHLSSYSLDTRIFDQYDFTVSDASPIRSVFLLATNEGFKIFKKIGYSLEELHYIQTALEFVRREYPYVVQFRNTKHGIPYVAYEESLYVVLDLIEGRECMFENPIDLKKASSALACYHAAARNVDLSCGIRDNSFRMLSAYMTMIKRMEDFHNIAAMHVNKTEFDEMFLENYDYHRKQALNALDELSRSEYSRLCSTRSTLCHHDLAHHNIIMGDDGNVYFIDFDYAVIDLPYHDLANLIRKASRYNAWSTEAYDHIIGAYGAMNGLEAGGQQVLYAYMLFPYDFYSVSNFYYSKAKDWEEEEYLGKLSGKVAYKEEREALLAYVEEQARNSG